MAAHKSVYCRTLHNYTMLKEDTKSYRLTPFIVTFCGVDLTTIDIENFIEMGLRMIRFKMTKLSHDDKLMLLAKFRGAVELFCDKYGFKNWPLAICIDVPNACIKTGCLNKNIGEAQIMLEENSVITVTSDLKYWDKCNKDILFMDDPHTFLSIKTGTEITLGCGKVIMVSIEVVNEQTIKCKIIQGGLISDLEFFCIRGVKHKKPPLSSYDLKIIEFAKENKLDIVIINSIRYPSTINRIRRLFDKDSMPQIISTICEQEGLDNVDSIIEISDGIILAREFMACEIVNKYQMTGIQKQLSAKCRQRGKPFFVSGNVLEDSLDKGMITDQDLSDITNAAIENTGLLLRELSDPSNLLIAMNLLDHVCRSVESINREMEFWRILDEIKMPANAAEASCLACALAAKQTQSKVIIVCTVSGKAARLLSQVAPESAILTICSDPATARKLQLYRGILSLIYPGNSGKSFEDEMNDRINFAVGHCITQNILKYMETYVVFRRSSIYSAYPDNLSVRTVSTTTYSTNSRKVSF